MPKYTKYLEFSQKERVAIKERDNYQCIFCQIGYKMPPAAVETAKRCLRCLRAIWMSFILISQTGTENMTNGSS